MAAARPSRCVARADRRVIPNEVGAGLGPEGAQCRGCVWHFSGGRGAPVDRCRRHRNEPVHPLWRACEAFAASLDCLTCGACCREAYHAVEIAPRDPFLRLHPERVSTEAWEGAQRSVVRRVPTLTGSRCSCLGDPPEGEDYRCVVYDTRPRTCRDFERGSVNCVEARRRVGLTR